MKSEDLFQDRLMEVKLGEILVLERRKIRAEDSDLFIIEFFEDVRSSCEMKHNPGNRRRGGMLPSH